LTSSPLLTSARLSLIPFGPSHLTDRYVAWLNDPEVVRFSEQRHRRHTAETCQAYVASFAGTQNHLWAMVCVDPDLGHIGNISATVDGPNRATDIAILIGEKKAWGRNLGTDAWSTAQDWLLGAGGMRKTTAGTMSENLGMLAIMRKTGMIEEGRRRAQFLLDGREVDLVLSAKMSPRRVS